MADLRIYKYTLAPSFVTLELPAGAKPLSVAFQGHDLQLWALVDVDAKCTELRLFCTYGTGWPIQHQADELSFIGTSRTSDGLVFHTFEVTRG